MHSTFMCNNKMYACMGRCIPTKSTTTVCMSVVTVCMVSTQSALKHGWWKVIFGIIWINTTKQFINNYISSYAGALRIQLYKEHVCIIFTCIHGGLRTAYSYLFVYLGRGKFLDSFIWTIKVATYQMRSIDSKHNFQKSVHKNGW